MASPTDPEEVVKEYFARVRGRDVRVADLFADDAKLVGLGFVRGGKQAIRDFYSDMIEHAGPTPQLAGPLLAKDGRVAAEINITLGDTTHVHVVDVFEVEAGLIQKLTYFVAQHPEEP